MTFDEILFALFVLGFGIAVVEMLIRCVRSQTFARKVLFVEGVGMTCVVGGWIGWLSAGWWLAVPCAFLGGLCGYFLAYWYDELTEEYGREGGEGDLPDDQGAGLHLPDLRGEQCGDTDSALGEVHEGVERAAGAPARQRTTVGD